MYLFFNTNNVLVLRSRTLKSVQWLWCWLNATASFRVRTGPISDLLLGTIDLLAVRFPEGLTVRGSSSYDSPATVVRWDVIVLNWVRTVFRSWNKLPNKQKGRGARERDIKQSTVSVRTGQQNNNNNIRNILIDSGATSQKCKTVYFPAAFRTQTIYISSMAPLTRSDFRSKNALFLIWP